MSKILTLPEKSKHESSICNTCYNYNRLTVSWEGSNYKDNNTRAVIKELLDARLMAYYKIRNNKGNSITQHVYLVMKEGGSHE